ncbi:MAG: thioesterase [Candidatus Azobacteroides sp.]|nr:thioesterase [Candidatus Azobacteroides sp.]
MPPYPKVEAFKFHIESYLCDLNEQIRLASMVNYMLDAATEHAEKRGFGYKSLKEDNRAWVLSRLLIEIMEYPKNESDLTIKTWVDEVARTFTYRNFSMHDETGKAIGYARSIWAAIDMETRRPMNLMDWRPEMAEYIGQEENCPIEHPGKITPVKAGIYDSFTVKYNDVDINKHVNSVRYIEHMIDTFGLSFFKEKHIEKFEIIYLTESTFGDILTIHREERTPEEYVVEIRKGNTAVCRCLIRWKNKKSNKIIS